MFHRSNHRFSGSLFLWILIFSAIGLQAQSDFRLEVLASPNAAIPGETLNVSFTVSNTGPFDKTDVALVFDYPVGLAFLGDSLHDGDCPSTGCDGGEQAIYTIDELKSGTGRTFLLPLRVSGSTEDGAVIPLTVAVFDDDAEQVSATHQLRVEENRMLELALTGDRDPIRPGETFHYVATYGVSEDSPGSPATALRIALPPYTELVGAENGGVFAEGVVTWDLGNLNPGAGGERKMALRVADDAPFGELLVGRAAMANAANPVEEVACRQLARIQDSRPLQIAMVANPDPVRPGETMDVEITVSNTGLFEATGAFVRLSIPDHLSFLSDSLYSGDCPSTGCESQERAYFDVGALAPGEGLTYSMPFQVSGTTLDGTVVSFLAELGDASGNRAYTATSFVVEDDRPLELAISEDRDPVVPGDILTYAATYGVRSDSAGSAAAALELAIPEGTSFVSADHAGSLTPEGVVSWSLGNLNPGQGGERRVRVRVDEGLLPGTQLVAEAAFSDASGNRVAGETVARIQDIALALEARISPNPAVPGETLDVELTVSNTGALSRTGVFVRLEYPDHLSFLSDSLYDGDCPSTGCEPTERSFFDVGDLAAGKSRTYSLPIRIHGSTLDGVVIPFEVEAYDAGRNIVETNAAVWVSGSREFELTLQENADPVAPGRTLTYTLTYGVLEFGTGAPGTVLEFTVPEGALFVSADEGGEYADGVVRWSIGSLNPGSGNERHVVVRVPSNAALGSLMRAEAVFRDNDEQRVTARTATRIEETIPLNLSVTANPDPVLPGEIMDVVLKVANSGPFDRTGVWVALEFPDHLSFLGDSLYDGDCPSTGCEATETSWFEVGTLRSGAGRVFSLPIRVEGSVQSGTVIALEARVIDATGDQRESGDAFLVTDARVLDLVMHADADPVLPGSQLTYTLSYAAFPNEGGVTDGELRLNVPEGLTYVGSEGCALVCCDTVAAPVCSLNPGDTGSRSFTFSVSEDIAPGALLEASAVLEDVSGGVARIRARTASRVVEAAPLVLSLTATPRIAEPGAVQVDLSVANVSAFDQTEVWIGLEIPENMRFLSDGDWPGDCPSTGCEPTERGFIQVGTLPAGETASFQLQPMLSSNAAGSVVNFDCFAYNSSDFYAFDTDTVRVGGERACVDDCDGVCPPECSESVRLIYPWISNRAGSFESILVANNIGEAGATVQLTATRPGDPPETVSRFIPARGFLEESAASLFPALGSGSGYSVILRAPSSNIRGRWVTNSLAAPSGQSPSQGVAVRIPAAESESNSRVGKEIVFGYLPLEGNYLSAPVVVNLGDATAEVVLRFYDRQGALVGTRTEFLNPAEPFAALANDLVDEGSGDVYMTAASENLISGVSFVFDSVFSEPAIGNVNAVVSGGSQNATLYYPWVSNSAGLFESILVVNNLGPDATTLTLSARRGDGTASSTIERTIPGMGFLREPAAQLFPDLGSGSGYNVIVQAPTSLLNGQWVTNNLAAASGSSPSQGVAVRVASIPDLERSGNHLLFGYLPVAGSFTSAPVIVNTGAQPTDVILRFYNAAGDLVAVDTESARNLAPGLPFASLANALLAEGSGNVYMVASSSGEPITGVAFVFNGAFNEPAIGNATAIDFNP